MFRVGCDKCGGELMKQGALLFGPPDAKGVCEKFHLCIECWKILDLGLIIGSAYHICKCGTGLDRNCPEHGGK